jgi:hypothetical protein
MKRAPHRCRLHRDCRVSERGRATWDIHAEREKRKFQIQFGGVTAIVPLRRKELLVGRTGGIRKCGGDSINPQETGRAHRDA